MNNNILSFMQMVRSGSNPEQLILQMLQQSAGNSPVGKNLIDLAKKNDGKGIEQIARNLCAQRGLDFDTEFAAFKKQLGL